MFMISIWPIKWLTNLICSRIGEVCLMEKVVMMYHKISQSICYGACLIRFSLQWNELCSDCNGRRQWYSNGVVIFLVECNGRKEV